MPKPVWTTSIVPYGADQTVYVVTDGGTLCQGREIERTELETVLADLMSGQFSDPIRVVAFNTLEHWSHDVSAEVAQEIQSRCDMDGFDIPQYLASFMETHLSRTGQSSEAALRARSAKAITHRRIPIEAFR